MKRRLVVDVVESAKATQVTLDCGHILLCNQIYWYPIGSKMDCSDCTQEQQQQEIGPALVVHGNWPPK